jgi:hypothetical protein
MISKTQMSILAPLLLTAASVSLENVAVTFTTIESFIRVIGYEGSYNLNMSLQLRTFQEEGVLMFHKFSSQGHLKIFLHEGQLKADSVSSGTQAPLTILEHYDTWLSDGEWHSIQFYIAHARAGLSINSHTVTGSLPSQIRTGGAVCSLVRPLSYLSFCRQLLQHWRRAAWRGGIYWVHEEPGGGWGVQE